MICVAVNDTGIRDRRSPSMYLIDRILSAIDVFEVSEAIQLRSYLHQLSRISPSGDIVPWHSVNEAWSPRVIRGRGCLVKTCAGKARAARRGES
jgi:hypothetical protein